MLKSIRPLLVLRLVLISGVLWGIAGTASAQTVIYDWSSNAKVPESYPTIRRRQNVKFRITKVNDILFTYKLNITQTASEADDFKKISALFKVFQPSGGANTADASDCQNFKTGAQTLIQQAIKEISEDGNLPVGYKNRPTYPTVSLDESIAAWRSHVPAVNAAAQRMEQFRNQCPADQTLENAFREFWDAVQKIQALVDKPHVFEDTHELSPGNDVSVDVIESFESQTIQTKTFKFSTGDVLTLSAGALFSTIQDRTYESRKSPNSTLNVLTVEGNSSATPGVVGLLNYSLGALGLDGENAGLALSAGPVIKFGGKAETSSFGFFAGLSTHLYHRVYITPGFHFGQFADFPVGFGDGSTIPANFGELTPVKRWTAKFGLAITFKTKDFSGLTSSETPSVNTENTGATNPSPSPSPSPSSDSAANLTAVPNTVASRFLRSPSERRSNTVQPTDLPASPDRVGDSDTAPSRLTTRNFPADVNRPSTTSVGTELNREITHVTSLRSENGRTGERVVLTAGNSIADYVTYFKGGRFYLVIPNAKLDVLQDELAGRTFSDPVFERRKGDLIISLTLLPGTRVSIAERADGLELLLMRASTN